MGTTENQQGPQAEQPQARAQERGAGNAHPRPTTQAERAVMHPQPGVFGRDDHHDPDWRHYFACGA